MAAERRLGPVGSCTGAERRSLLGGPFLDGPWALLPVTAVRCKPGFLLDLVTPSSPTSSVLPFVSLQLFSSMSVPSLPVFTALPPTGVHVLVPALPLGAWLLGAVAAATSGHCFPSLVSSSPRASWLGVNYTPGNRGLELAHRRVLITGMQSPGVGAWTGGNKLFHRWPSLPAAPGP